MVGSSIAGRVVRFGTMVLGDKEADGNFQGLAGSATRMTGRRCTTRHEEQRRPGSMFFWSQELGLPQTNPASRRSVGWLDELRPAAGLRKEVPTHVSATKESGYEWWKDGRGAPRREAETHAQVAYLPTGLRCVLAEMAEKTPPSGRTKRPSGLGLLLNAR